MGNSDADDTFAGRGSVKDNILRFNTTIQKAKDEEEKRWKPPTSPLQRLTR